MRQCRDRHGPVGHGLRRGRRNPDHAAGRCQSAQCDQRDKDEETDGPTDRDFRHPEQRFGQQQEAEERYEGPEVAGGIEEVGVRGARGAGLTEPGLDQRGIGGLDGKRQPDAKRIKPQGLGHDRARGVVGPVLRHGERQEQKRQDQKTDVQQKLSPGAQDVGC